MGESWLTGGILLLPSLLCGASMPVHAELLLIHSQTHADTAEVRRQIGQLEDQWHSALMTGDTASMTTMLADSYIGIGPDGTLESKTEAIAARENKQEQFQRLDVLDRRIRVYGSTAVVTSKVNLDGEYSGAPILGEYRYTRVWSLQHGQWRIVSFEASRIHDSSARSH